MSEKTEIAERIEALIASKGTNQRAVADRAGLNPTGVRDIVIGKVRNPRHDTIAKIARALDVDVAEILGGQSPVADESLQASRVVHVPRFRVQLSAGPGADIFDEKRDGSIPFSDDFFEKKLGRAGAKGLFVLDVAGDSMEPTIPKGSIVMIDTRYRAPDGSIMAFREGEFAYVKRLTKIDEGFEATSDNPALPNRTRVIRPADDGEFQIYGRICWVAHSL